MPKISREDLERMIDDEGIHIGDLVEIPEDSTSETEGIVINIKWRMFEPRLSYLVETAGGFKIWHARDSIKLIKVGHEQVVFT
jgi:hypothetical protein